MKHLLILYALSVAIVLVMCIYIFITEDMKNDMTWYSPIALIVSIALAPISIVAIAVIVIRDLSKSKAQRKWKKLQERKERHRAQHRFLFV